MQPAFYINVLFILKMNIVFFFEAIKLHVAKFILNLHSKFVVVLWLFVIFLKRTVTYIIYLESTGYMRRTLFDIKRYF